MPSPLIDLLDESDLTWVGDLPNLDYIETKIPVPAKPKPKPKMRMEPKGHDYKPTFEPVGESLFGEYLGVELEFESLDKSYAIRDELIYECHSILNSDNSKYCVLKKDGSLEYGFELCTRPCSLDHHREVLTNFFNNLPVGITASKRCGIHIHVSKEAMTKLQVGKILAFIHKEENRPFIKHIAQRGSCKHCDFTYTKGIKHSLRKYQNEFVHYSPVNLLNKDTVEFRIFAGSTDLSIVLKNLEFCHALTKFTFAGTASIEDSSSPSKFILFVKKHRLFYPNLVNFLNSTGFEKILKKVEDAKLIRKVR